MKCEVNEVWRLKSGRLAIIAQDSLRREKKLLWFNEIDRTIEVSDILDRLYKKTQYTLKDAIRIWMGV